MIKALIIIHSIIWNVIAQIHITIRRRIIILNNLDRMQIIRFEAGPLKILMQFLIEVSMKNSWVTLNSVYRRLFRRMDKIIRWLLKSIKIYMCFSLKVIILLELSKLFKRRWVFINIYLVNKVVNYLISINTWQSVIKKLILTNRPYITINPINRY